VDGSESKFTQWELELQASMEKLNRLSIEKAFYAKERENAQSSSDLRDVLESNTVNRTCYNLLTAERSNTRDLNQFSRSAKKDSDIAFEENTAFVGKQIPYLRRSCSTINSAALSNASRHIVSKSNISKSLSNSPVNRIASNLDDRITKKVEGANISKHVPNRMSRPDKKDQKTQSSWNIISPDINATSENQERNDCNTNDTLVNNVQLTSLSSTQAANIENSGSSSSEHHTAASSVVNRYSSQDDARLLQTRSDSNIPQKSTSCSANSSPMKAKKLLMLTGSSNSASVENIDGESIIKKYKSKTASIRELPLLSFFGSTSTLSVIRGKSCSMIDLDNKQNLKTLLDNSLLSNIQAVSAERLANVRHKLINDHPRATTDDIKKISTREQRDKID